ncbi:MAG: hypothetical protein HY727_19875 [Candidatus Rokubacteria bacterium]|nr:hypothetical protein [Candidatus Rokubacteria bacterium]
MRARTVRRGVYEVYGLRFRSSIPLASLRATERRYADAALLHGSPARFARVWSRLAPGAESGQWFHHALLPDGARYLRWSGLAEFLVGAGGRTVHCHPLAEAAFPTAFETYLLGQVLSFVLIARGIEPLHATTVVVGDEAIAFVGDCGYGKSTLGAAFLQAGDRLLTDDLLVVKREKGRFLASPGPPRVKLFPETAAALLGNGVRGEPMNALTPKLVIPLAPEARAPRAVPLRAIYVLTPPSRRPLQRIVIRPLPPRRAFVELTRNTFNAIVSDPRRLARQFDVAARLSAAIPVRALGMPRGLERLSEVRETILSDLVA